MAGGTAPPHGATRFVETTRGVLSYSQLAPILAERVLVIGRVTASGEFEDLAITPKFIDLTPTGPEAIARYIGALREADALNWSPLRGIWEVRFGGDVERRGPSG